jgi:DNA-binding PadR family transcriptional regulator
MPSPRFPIPQGTLDMLILQILSLESAHGHGIARRLELISPSVVRVNEGSLYPDLHRLEQKGWLRGAWNSRRPAARPSSTPLRRLVAASLPLRRIAGRVSPAQST